MGRIVSFSNQKGGVGKTTTCVNVSACLAKRGKKVLVVDLDPQGNATSAVGIDKNKEIRSIYNVITNDCNVCDTVIKTKIENLDIIPAEINLAGAEIELVQMENREKVLKTVLSILKDKYDYIVIDCPPSLGLLTVNALTASEGIIIPITCEFFSLEGLSQLMNTVLLVKQHLNPILEIDGVVITMKNVRGNLTNQVAEEIKKFFKKKVFETSIPRTVRLAEAPSYGLPIIEYDPKGKGAQAYIDLTDEYLARERERIKGEQKKNA